MNIVELHEKVRFWLDKNGSPRFDQHDIDPALRSAIDGIVNEKLDQFQGKNPVDVFQATQLASHHLWPLVKSDKVESGNITIDGNVVDVSSVSGFRFFLGAVVTIDGQLYPSFPISYNRYTVIKDNPFRKPRLDGFAKVYHIEKEENKYELLFPEGKSATDIEIYFIKDPDKVSYGFEYGNSKTFSKDDVLISTFHGTVYNGTSYKIGETLTILSDPLNLEEGKAVIDYTNCNLPSILHEEIAFRAANNLYAAATKQSLSVQE